MRVGPRAARAGRLCPESRPALRYVSPSALITKPKLTRALCGRSVGWENEHLSDVPGRFLAEADTDFNRVWSAVRMAVIGTWSLP